jgi:hypothetical protein
MALTTNVPPQAYTRETLVKALEWVSGQSPSVRERAKSADLLVSLYLQARRQAAANAVQMEAPVSGEAFKADLKHLAEDLKKFEDPSPPQQPIRTFSSGPISEMPPQPQPPPASGSTSVTVQTTVQTPPPPTQTTPAPGFWAVDSRSLAAAREWQNRLNLSNEHEALRFLITLGAERARELFR